MSLQNLHKEVVFDKINSMTKGVCAMNSLQPLDKYATVVLLLKREGGAIKFYLARKKQDIHTNTETLKNSATMNGYGGKLEVEDNGSMRACAIRELKKESLVNAKEEDLILAAKVRFFRDKVADENLFMKVTFFLLWEYEGTPVETDEMGPPRLFSMETAPFETDMMENDKLIFSGIFSGKFVEAVIIRKKDNAGKRHTEYGPISIHTPKVSFFENA